jgi:uncharacterized protein
MVHLKNDAYSPKDATALLYRARSLVEQNGLVVRDARVSRKYLEYDVSMPDEINENDVVKKMESISPMVSVEQVVERHIGKDEAIRLAISSFNDEKYWSAHELLEGVWKQAEGTEKSIINGIILVAAAFVHDQKDEPEICISILRRALAKLGSGQGTYSGIDIDRLATNVVEIVNTGKIKRFAI